MADAPRCVFISGVTSGIGEGLARLAVSRGHRVTGVGRRAARLAALKRELGPRFTGRRVDLKNPKAAREAYRALGAKAGGFDLVILNAGWGSSAPQFAWEADQDTIAVNVTGFACLANAAYHEFKKRGRGHLVGVSSVAGLRGMRYAPAYNGSKAFVDKYLEGLRHKAAADRLDVTVTNIRPGFVDTAMADPSRAFWVAPVPKACRQIWRAIEKKKRHAYVTRRWRLMAWVMRAMPEWVLHRA